MVGDLEEKLQQTEQERTEREARLESTIKTVVRENEELRKSLQDAPMSNLSSNIRHIKWRLLLRRPWMYLTKFWKKSFL
jgi:hypothetical protein